MDTLNHGSRQSEAWENEMFGFVGSHLPPRRRLSEYVLVPASETSKRCALKAQASVDAAAGGQSVPLFGGSNILGVSSKEDSRGKPSLGIPTDEKVLWVFLL